MKLKNKKEKKERKTTGKEHAGTLGHHEEAKYFNYSIDKGEESQVL